MGLVDENGELVVKYSYDVWGVPTEYDANGNVVPVGTFTNPYLYKGYYYDTETGLYYLNARYYDPTIGRFLSRDLAPGNKKDRLDLNSYLYCKNNPIRTADPSGLKSPYWHYRHYRYYYFKAAKRKSGWYKGHSATYWKKRFLGIWHSRVIYGRQWYVWRAGYWGLKKSSVDKKWNRIRKKYRSQKQVKDYVNKYKKRIAYYMRKRPKLFAKNEKHIPRKLKWAAGTMKLWSMGGKHREVANAILDPNVKIKFDDLENPRYGEFHTEGWMTGKNKESERLAFGRGGTIILDNQTMSWDVNDVASAIGHEGYHARDWLSGFPVASKKKSCEFEAWKYTAALDDPLGTHQVGEYAREKLGEGHTNFEKYLTTIGYTPSQAFCP